MTKRKKLLLSHGGENSTAVPSLPDDHKDVNSYELCLRMAGATVHAFGEFGSYQGDWWALVTLPDGRTGWITDYYGSCSGCDAFQADFGWTDDERDDYPARLAAFGRPYLEHLITQEQAEAKAGENVSWDMGAVDMLAWVKDEGSKPR